MAKLKTMEKVVLQVLEESPAARGDDNILMYLVISKLNPELCDIPFSRVLYHHTELGLPNFKTIERCRRKLQEKYPQLKDPKKAAIRNAEKQEYIEYSHT